MARKINALTFNSHCTKRISYVLPTKNRAKLLRKALERTRRIKRKNDELIIIDGGSTDNTLSVIESFGDVVDRCVSEPDISTAHATNKGILLSRGKYIKFLSDDDIYYEKAMEQALTILEKHPGIEILECGGTSYNHITKHSDTFYKPAGINFGGSLDDMFKFRTSGLSLIIKRSVFSKVGLFPASDLIADSTFIVNSFRAKLIIKFARIKLFRFIIHGTNTSLDPRSSRLIYNLVKNNASKKYFLRYAFNWYLNKYKLLKFIFSPLIVFLYVYRQLGSEKYSKDLRYIWDGGFS